MLMKPRRWLGYTVCLNDELPRSEQILDHFEQSSIPLADTFGSSSDVSGRTQSVIVMFGPRVERDRLVEVLDLLASAEQPVHFLMASTGPSSRKTIYIGAYNLDGERVAPLTDALALRLRSENPSPDDLLRLVLSASTVTPITSR
jgi:hypothetical protein